MSTIIQHLRQVLPMVIIMRTPKGNAQREVVYFIAEARK
jgi:hypothetical protein